MEYETFEIIVFVFAAIGLFAVLAFILWRVGNALERDENIDRIADEVEEINEHLKEIAENNKSK